MAASRRARSKVRASKEGGKEGRKRGEKALQTTSGQIGWLAQHSDELGCQAALKGIATASAAAAA